MKRATKPRRQTPSSQVTAPVVSAVTATRAAIVEKVASETGPGPAASAIPAAGIDRITAIMFCGWAMVRGS